MARERIVRKLATGVWQFGEQILIRWGKDKQELLDKSYSPYNARHIAAAKKLRAIRAEENKIGKLGNDYYLFPFESAVDRYLNLICNKKTYREIKSDLEIYWIPKLKGRVLGAIHQTEIDDIKSSWRKKDGSQYSSSEIKNRLIPCRQVFKKHQIWPNPVDGIEVQATQKLPVDKYEEPERQKLISASNRFDYTRRGDFNLILILGFACGLRTGEILAVTKDCFSDGFEDVHIYQSVKQDGIDTTKTCQHRWIYIPVWARESIRRYVSSLDEYDFLFVNSEGNIIKDRKPLYKRHKDIHQEMKIPLQRRGYATRDIYTCRHTRASELISQPNTADAECARELGHGIGVFQRIYGHFINSFSGKKDRSHLDGVAVQNHGLHLVD